MKRSELVALLRETAKRVEEVGVEECQVEPSDRTAEDVLEHVAAQKQRKHFVLQQTNADQPRKTGVSAAPIVRNWSKMISTRFQNTSTTQTSIFLTV